ncbi:hypothetical protein RBH29_17365 [Herbivorax sp. ANBcel31]|uniref:hypothetical protein n=1 Tax=Herbivorax sp. ANBcel31 TaxID=3069754 RepID=UPI0027B655C9|nr:hypothetical protein [Herbivorax sp. ANBcel31]MDQ2088195.1 hypothetical protein [Herbivorax sp. ANBcel31]
MEELRLACEKFINKEYTVEDLSRVFSWIAVPEELQDIVSEAENKLEYVRFCVSDNEQYDEGLKIVKSILIKIN